ncbi:MAG TPA: nuclear transport factor 2 family protein [Candidatus Eisenbacteria bacterium]|jgi:ketosteroid isomerase-like protein
MTEPDKSILAMFAAYRAAVFAKDVEAFAALYDSGVRVFDMWGEWSYDGLPAWRGMAAQWFGSLGAERVVVEFADARTAAEGDLAVADAFVTYRRVTAEGKELRGMRNRITWALRRSGDRWKVVHEHTSAPVDFDTSKVIGHD